MGNEKLVVIDDSPIMTNFLSNFLKNNGYQVIACNSSIEGLELIKTHRPDCIITDNDMPELSGVDVCRHVKAEPSIKMTPIIMLTSKAQDEDIVRAVEAGADDYLIKKSSQAVILIKIRAMLRLKQLRDELVALQQLEAVKNMVVTISHEFNNTMAIIMGQIRVSKQAMGDGACCSLLGQLEDKMGMLTELIRKLQKLEKYKTKRYGMDVDMVDVD